MGEHEREKCQPVATGAASSAEVGTDRSRRKFTAAGLAGTGVLMTLSNRSALGAGFGQCGSESVSAALSRHGEVSFCGCSPGFWWRSPHGNVKWKDPNIIPALYGPDAMFNLVFDINFLKVDEKLVNLGPGGDKLELSDTHLESCKGESGKNIHAVIFHAIAALLNAHFYGSRYPAPYKTPDAVIMAFQTAALDTTNPCGKLNDFKELVDVYDENGGLWCFEGQSESGDEADTWKIW